MKPSLSKFELNTGIGGGRLPVRHPAVRAERERRHREPTPAPTAPSTCASTRSDADQEITSYSATLPPGLLGRLVGIPYCPEAAIAHARATPASPSRTSLLPGRSPIGKTTAGYGLGSALTYAPGNLYLAGPYRGAPLSIVAIDSAIVGPFDLGVVIVRSAIQVDPRTAQVSIDSAASDPIPHILNGIPLHLRDVRVYIDRPDFTLNPTSCEPMASTRASPAPEPTSAARPTIPRADASVPFQVSNCSALGFRPALACACRATPSRGDFPNLIATYTPRPGDANLDAVTVDPAAG